MEGSAACERREKSTDVREAKPRGGGGGRKDRQTSETKKRWKVLMARNGTSNEDPAWNMQRRSERVLRGGRIIVAARAIVPATMRTYTKCDPDKSRRGNGVARLMNFSPRFTWQSGQKEGEGRGGGGGRGRGEEEGRGGDPYNVGQPSYHCEAARQGSRKLCATPAPHERSWNPRELFLADFYAASVGIAVSRFAIRERTGTKSWRISGKLLCTLLDVSHINT